MSLQRRSSRRDRAEEPVLLVVWTRREEQRVERSVGWAAVSELQRPQPVDRELLSVRGPERADELPCPVRQLLERVDVPVAEVADEQVAAEGAEAGGGHREAPRGIQLAVLRDAREQVPVRVEGVDEAEALAVELVIRAWHLFRERHEDPRVDRLDPKRCVAAREVRIREPTGSPDGRPRRIEDVNPRVMEVGRVELRARCGRRYRKSLVDRSVSG